MLRFRNTSTKAGREELGRQAEDWFRQLLKARGLVFREFCSDYMKPDFLIGERVYVDTKAVVNWSDACVSSYAWDRMVNTYRPSAFVILSFGYDDEKPPEAKMVRSQNIVFRPVDGNRVTQFGRVWNRGVASGRTPFGRVDLGCLRQFSLDHILWM